MTKIERIEQRLATEHKYGPSQAERDIKWLLRELAGITNTVISLNKELVIVKNHAKALDPASFCAKFCDGCTLCL